MYKCKNCGEELDFFETKEIDYNLKDGNIWIVEEWECLECDIMVDVEIKGKITDVVKNV